MKVVTSGWRYLDIDAYGSIVAYAELLNLLGEKAVAVSTAPFNESITETVRSWKAELVRDYQSSEWDSYILIDLSDPEIFDRFVDQTRVEEVIDHHMEFVDYWHERPETKAQIEFIGAACTLVYERWQASGRLNEISGTSARLLMTGILDNTLNFEAGVTTARDQRAYKELTQYADLSEDWPAQYFEACQRETMADIKGAVQHDIKILEFPSLRGKIGTGQLVVWNAKEIIDSHLASIREAVADTGENWFMNIVSVGQKKNYLLTSNETMQAFLTGLMHARFENGVGETDRLWLRKEIMKEDLNR